MSYGETLRCSPAVHTLPSGAEAGALESSRPRLPPRNSFLQSVPAVANATALNACYKLLQARDM